MTFVWLCGCGCGTQVELMWQKFGAGIWEALAKKYLEIDMNDVSSMSCQCAARCDTMVITGAAL